MPCCGSRAAPRAPTRTSGSPSTAGCPCTTTSRTSRQPSEHGPRGARHGVPPLSRWSTATLAVQGGTRPPRDGAQPDEPRLRPLRRERPGGGAADRAGRPARRDEDPARRRARRPPRVRRRRADGGHRHRRGRADDEQRRLNERRRPDDPVRRNQPDRADHRTGRRRREQRPGRLRSSCHERPARPRPDRTRPPVALVRGYLGGELVLDTVDPLYVWEGPRLPAVVRAGGGRRVTACCADGDHHALAEPGDRRGRLHDAGRWPPRPSMWRGATATARSRSCAIRVRIDWAAWTPGSRRTRRSSPPARPDGRIAILPSSRHVVVSVDGVVVADSTTRRLHETGLPMRTYVPKIDVRMELLDPDRHRTRRARTRARPAYWTLRLPDGTEHADLAWSYPTPLRESHPVAGLGRRSTTPRSTSDRRRGQPRPTRSTPVRRHRDGSDDAGDAAPTPCSEPARDPPLRERDVVCEHHSM